MSASQIFFGVALTVGLAVACQIVAGTFRIPAIILLLPVGFAAGALIPAVNPDQLFGAAFPPLVSLAVAVVLFDGGLTWSGKIWAARTAVSFAGCVAWGYRSPGPAPVCWRGCCSACQPRRRSCSARF